MNAYAIILAAGASSRMGQCKAALPWIHGSTLLSYQVEQWLKVNVVPVVVLSPDNAHLQSTLHSQSLAVINPNPAMGKTQSILIGLKQIPLDFDVLAIAAVDQPRPAWVYQTLLDAHQTALITAPSHQGRLGHPVLFSASLRSGLESLREETLGLRDLLQTLPVQRVEFETAIVRTDLNTPDDYQYWFQASL